MKVPSFLLSKSYQMKFKNNHAEKLSKSVLEAVPDLDSRKKGYVARSMMLLIADAYFEDRPAIFAMFEARFKESRDPRNKTKGPGPKVYADAKTRPQAVEQHKQYVQNSRTATSSGESGNCANCDEDLVQDYQKQKQTKQDAPAPEPETEQTKLEGLAGDMLESPEALLDAFDNDAKELARYAAANDIKLGNAKKPEVIAKIIIEKSTNG